MVNIYNNLDYSLTGFSPFELMVQKKSRLPMDEVLGTYPFETEDILAQLWHLWNILDSKDGLGN